jgi:hypothetical protein
MVGIPLDFSYRRLMYNATPISGGTLRVAAVSPGEKPDRLAPAGCTTKNTFKMQR